MSHLLRILFTAIILTVLAGIALYFAADGVKEKGLALLYGSPYVPSDFKKVLESVYSSPAIKHQQLIEELNRNIGAIEKAAQKFSASSPDTLKAVARSKEIIQEVLAKNIDPAFVKTVSEAVTQKLAAPPTRQIGSGVSCPQK
jgi:hypothetical protein